MSDLHITVIQTEARWNAVCLECGKRVLDGRIVIVRGDSEGKAHDWHEECAAQVLLRGAP